MTNQPTNSGDSADKVPGKALPEDPKAFEDCIRPMRVMVRPILMGISRMAKTLDTDPLDKDEIESGEVAFAALMYQYGAMLDARVLVALWLAGVSIPRALQYMEKKKTKETIRKQSQGADSVKPERVVQGQVVLIKQEGS